MSQRRQAARKGPRDQGKAEDDHLMGNEGEVQYQAKFNYFELILDTYQSAKLLNTLDLGLLDSSLEIFRENLFEYPDFGRRVTTKKIAQLFRDEIRASSDNSGEDSGNPMLGKLLEAYGGTDGATGLA